MTSYCDLFGRKSKNYDMLIYLLSLRVAWHAPSTPATCGWQQNAIRAQMMGFKIKTINKNACAALVGCGVVDVHRAERWQLNGDGPLSLDRLQSACVLFGTVKLQRRYLSHLLCAVILMRLRFVSLCLCPSLPYPGVCVRLWSVFVTAKSENKSLRRVVQNYAKRIIQ